MEQTEYSALMKNLIRLTAIAMLVLFAFVTKAQQPPNFKAEEAAGIVTYDSEKVIKKLKIEEEEVKKSITTAIGEYNMEMYELADAHGATFQELDDDFNRQVQIAMQRRDRSQMDGVKSKIRETIPPIREQAMQHENVLNASMKSTLDEKQYNKWLKYQKSQKPSNNLTGG